MFDLNAIVSAAISAAITEATKPLLERIATLESANDILHRTQHEDMVAMRDRITALEDTGDRLYARIAVLENNPAQGVDTSVVAGNYTPISNEQIKAALQKWATKDALLEHLDNQEWFWEKLQNRIDSTVEAGIDEHCSNYDHDDYDSHVSDDDKHFDGDIEDAVRDALSNMTFDISVR